MEDLLIEILETFGVPVIRQGSLSKDEPYPDEFFTFWNNYSESMMFYDNDENALSYDYDVNFYSTDPEHTFSKLLEAKSKLKEQGFIITGAGYDIGSDEETHTGRGINVQYLK